MGIFMLSGGEEFLTSWTGIPGGPASCSHY